MPNIPGALAGALTLLSANLPRLFWRLLPFLLVYAALLVAERFVIAKMDWFIAVDTMEVATNGSVIISAVATWARLCVIGVAVWRALALLREDGDAPGDEALLSGRFLGLWAVIALLLAAALLGVDLWLNSLRFQEGEIGGETVRGMWLASIYVQLLALYLAARWFFGAGAYGRGGPLGGAWVATGIWRSLWLFVVLVGLKLVIENVFVTMISYVPVLAPFWFIPNELSESRFFVGQGARITAETLGVLLYVAFFVAVDREVVRRAKEDGAAAD